MKWNGSSHMRLFVTNSNKIMFTIGPGIIKVLHSVHYIFRNGFTTPHPIPSCSKYSSPQHLEVIGVWLTKAQMKEANCTIESTNDDIHKYLELLPFNWWTSLSTCLKSTACGSLNIKKTHTHTQHIPLC